MRSRKAGVDYLKSRQLPIQLQLLLFQPQQRRYIILALCLHNSPLDLALALAYLPSMP
jgi:hypothetical protein